MIALILFLLVAIGTPVLAQSPEAALKTDLIWEQERLDDEITKTRTSYNQGLEDYRVKSKNQAIAADQYESLNTLASLEDLVSKTRNLALSRDQVMFDYFTLLKLNLISATGVELELKDKYLTTLDQALEFLTLHQNL